ncbi:MAG: GMC family oxidoreductase [Acidimicrobiia bacterium]|jgi:choline dehydrogenase-like flavoprotein
MGITSKEIAAFDAVVGTLLPAVDGDDPAWTTPGSELGLGAKLPKIFERLPHDETRKDIKLFLGLLDSRVGGVLLFGRPRPFTRLTLPGRVTAVHRMESHRLGLVRNGIKALKTLIAFLWVSTEDPEEVPTAWNPMGYPGPDGPPPSTPKPLTPLTIQTDTTLESDIVVIGSGAGGGVAAGVLAVAGHDVVVLEAGGYHNEADFTHLEADAYRDLYLDGALNTTADGGIGVLAGSTLGGGTVINYTTSFETPARVREEWDRVAGFSEVFTGPDYAAGTDAVKTRLRVNRDHGWPSNRAQLMEKGLRDLGWHVDEMPRNAVGCTDADCGYCTLGCRTGAKQSTLLTYLQDAADAGARIVTNANVVEVTTERNRATGVLAKVGEHTLEVKARTVVLAAGALNTPAILLRSGVGGPATGDYLRLHPVTAVWARFEQRVDPWTGVLQTRYSDQFTDLDGHGYGFKFETAPIHPLFPASFIGWEDGESFKRDILGLGHLDVGGILLRDRDHGRVTLRKDGSPIWDYSISRHDQQHIREGVRRATEMYIAAGAAEIVSSTIRPVRWIEGGSVDEYMDAVDAIGYGSNRMAYLTFHQMGSARMGSDPGTSVVDDNNMVHGVTGLYVMDGSCFPTASGVNPMLSIASIAHRGATLLARRL